MSSYSTDNININLCLSHPSLSYYNFFNSEGHPKIGLLKILKPAIMPFWRVFGVSFNSKGHPDCRMVRGSGQHDVLSFYIFFNFRGTFNSRVAQILCARAGALMCRCACAYRRLVLTPQLFCVKITRYSLGDFFVVNNYKNKSPSGFYSNKALA